ncbi:hypothetical protein N431DRAFT_103886 [Stipitochalara longipes BDJ]|nr:hypothetical protein N431DRAFT_103886 [Stipitochalara longipes BDJ]
MVSIDCNPVYNRSVANASQQFKLAVLVQTTGLSAMPRGKVRQTRYLPASRGSCRVPNEVNRGCSSKLRPILLHAGQGCRAEDYVQAADLDSRLRAAGVGAGQGEGVGTRCEASQFLHEA